MELLLKWARSQGCGTRKLAICSTLPRAFVASEDVCVGDTLVVIPQRVLLHADCAYRDPEFGQAFSRLKEELHVELDARSVLCLLLIVEKAKQQSSGWAPYISLLPDVYDDPYWWHEDQLQLLRGTRLSRSVAQYMPGLHQLASWMARLYELHRETQLASMDQGVSPIEAATAVTSTDMPAAQRSGRTLLATYESGWCLSLAAARWARSTVWSRSFTVRRLADGTTNAVAMVPVLDMIDHSPAMEVVWHTGALGDEPFQYTTLTALKKGTVLANNYGAKTSDELLLAYGFLLPHWNPTDHFQVSLAHSQLSTTGGPAATAPAAAPAHASGSRTHKLPATPTGSAPADQQPAALGAPLGALPAPPSAPPPTATQQVSPGAGIPAGFGTALPTVAAPQREAGDEGSDAELARVQLGAEDVQRQLALSAAGLGTQHHLRLHDPLPQGLLLSAQLCLASGSQLYSLTASLTAHMQQQQLPGHGQTLVETQPQLEPSHEEHCCVPAASLTDGHEQVAASSPAANTLSHILMAPTAMHIMASTPTASSHRQHHSGGSHGSSRKRPPPEQNSSSAGMAQQVRVGQPHHRHHRHHRQHHRHEHDPHAQPSGPGPCPPSGPHGPSAAAAAAPHHSMGEESGLQLQRYREQATPVVAVPGASDPIHALPAAQLPTPAPPAPGPCHLLEHGLQQQQIPALASLRKQLQGKLDAMASSQELDFAAQCVPTAHTTASLLHPGSSSSTQGSGTASVQAPGYCPSDPVRHKRSGAVAMETDTSCSPLHDLPPPCKPCLSQCQPCPTTAAPTAAGPHSWVLPDLCGLLPGPAKASKELGSPQLACGQVRGQHHHTQLAVQYVRSQQALVRSALTALQHSSSQLVHAASHEVLRCMESTGSHQHILLSTASTPHPTVRTSSTAFQGPGSSSAAPHEQTSQVQPAAPSPGNAPVPFLCLDPNAHLQQYHVWLAQHGLLAAPSRSHTTTPPNASHQTASQQRTLAASPAPSPPCQGSAVSLSARPSTPRGWSAQQPACSPLAAPCALIAEAVCRRSAPRCNTPSHSTDSSSCGQDIGQPLANLAPGSQALAPGPNRDSQTGMHNQAGAGSRAGTGSQHAAAPQGPGVAVAAELPAKAQAAPSAPGGGGCPRSRAPPSSSRTFRVTKPAPDTSKPPHLAMPGPQQGTGPPTHPPSPPTASASTPTPLGQPGTTTPLTRVNLPEGLAVSLGLDSKHDPLAWGATLVQDCHAGAILLQVPQACCLAAPSRPALVQQLMAAAHVLLESLVPAVWAKARGGQGGRGGAGADGTRLAAVQVRPSSQVDMLVWHLMHCVAAGPAARLSGAEAEGVQLLADMLEDSPAGSAYQGVVDGLTTEFLELRTQLSASTASSSGLSPLALAALRRVLARPSAFALFCWAHHAVQQCAVSAATSTAPGSTDTWLVPGPSQPPDPPTQLHPAKYYHLKHDSRQEYDAHHQQQQQHGVQKLDQSQQEQLPQELWVLAPVLAAVPCLLRDATLSWRVNRHPTHPGFLLEVRAACSLHAGLMLSPLLLLHQQDWEEQMLQHGPEALAWSALLAAGRSASRPPSTQPPACPPQQQHPASTPSSCSSLEQPASIVPAAAAAAAPADLSSSKASGSAPSQMHQPSETQLQLQVLEAAQQAPGLPGNAQALRAQVLYELYICPEEQDRLCKAKLALLAAAGLGCSHHLTCDLSTEPLVAAALKVCLATKSLLSHSLAAQVLEAHAQLNSLAAAQPTDASLSTLGCQGSAHPLLPTPSTPPSQQASAQLASDSASLLPTQHQGQAPPSCTREQAAQRLASLQAQLVRMLADLPQDHPACRAARKQLRQMVHEARKNTRRRLRQLEAVHTHVTPGAHALAVATSGLDLGGCYSPLGGSTALHQGVLLYLQGLVEVLDEWAEHLGLNRQSDSMSKRSRH